MLFSRSVALRFVILLLILGGLGACAPRLAPPGSLSNAAALTPDSLITEDGLPLPLRSWLPGDVKSRGETTDHSSTETNRVPLISPASTLPPKPKAIILALHGFNDYSNAFDGPGTYWAKAGIATYAYDQRGFGAAPHRGLWGGHDRMIADLRNAIARLHDKHPDTPLFLVGESMGGAVIMAALQENPPLDVDGIVLSAPAVWARQTMPWYQRASLWLVAHTTPWASFTGSGLKIQASDNIPMLIGLGKDPLVIKSTRIDAVYGLTDLMDAAYEAPGNLTLPALLLYGEKDEVVPWKPTRDVWQSLPNGIGKEQRAALYEEGWHMLLRDLQAETVLNDIAHWIINPTAPLPSAADANARQALINNTEQLQTGEIPKAE
ncbi:lysophospholipase [Kiloniella laminariae]|uniref:Lysophospholipase n=1 Tax=Kiloniella laminariae TaxID=454162 RepID=A0ABT4LJS2_9PROT|nr:alpha/beta hydrolase [Kiloniella laminariae]MCZ4281353.1 lysophospholipase [Kiloniella laminariae]